jgi:hypothetical protein
MAAKKNLRKWGRENGEGKMAEGKMGEGKMAEGNGRG